MIKESVLVFRADFLLGASALYLCSTFVSGFPLLPHYVSAYTAIPARLGMGALFNNLFYAAARYFSRSEKLKRL